MSDLPPPERPGQTALRVYHGVLIDTPLIPGWRSQAWAATVWLDDRAPGGWGRAVMPPGPGGRGYVADGLTPGDVIEFGADYPRQTGRKTFEMVPRRWYGVALATAADHVVAFGPFPGPGPASEWADRALTLWRQTLVVDIPGLTDATTPDPPALPNGRAARATPTVEIWDDGRHPYGKTTVNDPTHGMLSVDTQVYEWTMVFRDTPELVGLLAGVDGLRLRGDEPKATLAALATLHRRSSLIDITSEVTRNGTHTTSIEGAYGDYGVDTALWRTAMAMDTDELKALIGRAEGWSLRGDEPKEVLAAAVVLLSDMGNPPHGVKPFYWDKRGSLIVAGEASASPDPARYYGHPDGSVERVDGNGTRPLRPAMRWSPDGFSWGYLGDGPTELADALLADSTGSADVAGRHARRYSAEVIAELPHGQAWSLPVATVSGWAAQADQRPPIVAASRRSTARDRDVGAGL